MRVDWDAAKHDRNRKERGFGFDFASLIFEGATIEWPDDRRDYGQARVGRSESAATTEDDIRRHQVENGEDPDSPLPPFRPVPNVLAIRTKLRMTQEVFAKAIGVPLAMVRDWEQSRGVMDPAVRPLLLVVEREPDAAPRALTG